MHFTSCSYKHKGGKNLYAIGSLEILNSSQPYARFPPYGPDGGGVLAGGEMEHGVANK
jgi:hypothetical protein